MIENLITQTKTRTPKDMEREAKKEGYTNVKDKDHDKKPHEKLKAILCISG